MLPHQFAQKREAVHPRHLNIEDNHARDRLAEHRDRFVRIGRYYNPKLRVGLNDRFEPLPNQCTVVDNQNLDRFWFSDERICRGPSAPSHARLPLLLKQ
jgi:hypothetical protein